MDSKRQTIALLIGTACLALPVTATAQSDAAPVSAEAPAPSPRPWTGSLSIGANLNVASNQNVVGQTDGYSALVGLSSNGTATYTDKPHELRLNGTLNESFARTATLEEFVKNNDSLDLEGIYNYYFLDWSGGYGRLGVGTSLFENYNVTADPANYEIEQQDGTTQTVSEIERFKVSDPFKPTTLSQSVGGFVGPDIAEEFQPRGRLGLGARETFARNVVVIDDDPETDAIEARQLADVYQGGVEAFAGASGAFTEQKLSYEVGITGLLPILNNDPEDRSATELFQYGFTGKLTFNAFEWLSANYNVELTRNPQLIDRLQVQNNVLLTFKYDLISASGPTEPTPEEQLEEARDRIDTLETRIQEMEGSDDGENRDDETDTPGDSDEPAQE